MDMGDAGLTPGVLLAGRYRVGDRIGRGGSATVHRARDEVLGRDVALKAVGSTDPATHERERLEIDLLATLSHRSLVTIYDAVPASDDGPDAVVLVMELVDGPTLSERRAERPIADGELLRMARDLAEALAVVHAAGVVHRDVKPSNILLAPSPLPEHEFDARLADFGIAAIDGGDRMTATGAVMGTAAYLSPEQATGGDVGPAADVYALGLVLLETMTGERTFPGPAIEALTARVLRDPVIPPTIEPRWTALLRAMTSRDPAARPSTDELRAQLAALAAEGVPTRVAPEAGTDVATAVIPAIGAAATAAMTAPLAAAATTPMTVAAGAAGGMGVDGSAPTSLLPVVDGSRDPVDVPARRRRGLVLGIVGVLAAAAAISVAAVALQSLPADESPTSPSDVTEVPTDPSEAPSPSPTPSTTDPAPEPSPTQEPAPTSPTTEPTQQPTQQPTQEPTQEPEPEPTQPEPSVPVPVPSEPAPVPSIPPVPSPAP